MLIRVRRIMVERLFDLYNHDFTLFLDDRVTILHGPNGVGKTVLLKLVHALFNQDYLFLLSTPFDALHVELDDQSSISVTKPGEKSDAIKNQSVHFSLKTASGERHEYAVQSENLNFEAWAHAYEQQSPYVYQVGQNQWMVQPNDEILNAIELYRRFSSETTTKIPSPVAVNVPIEFENLYKRVNTFFIEAQRLIRARNIRNRRSGLPDSSMTAAVMEDAQQLARQLSEALLAYSRTAQDLDQSFPLRFFKGSVPNLTTDQISAAVQALEDERSRLHRLGVVDIQQPAYSFNVVSPAEIDDATSKAMSLYVSDSQSKLSVMSEFANRVEPLITSINSRFKNKSIRLDREKGLVATSNSPNQVDIRPDQLSSGEQHEIVLLYALLFRVRANTLVLIDEPELSLHIDWQRQFLPELLTIANRTGFDALIATHSASIVGERADLMVGLSAEAKGTNA